MVLKYTLCALFKNDRDSAIAYFLHLKDYTLVLEKWGLQGIFFTLKCVCIKRKCVNMIQPINAFSPQAGFKRRSLQSRKSPQERTQSQIALINAVGTSVIAGGLTTAIARSYTNSWAHAGILGICGTVLSMFFIAPLLVENTTLLGSKKKRYDASGIAVKEKAPVPISAKEVVRPVKRLVQFKQQS